MLIRKRLIQVGLTLLLSIFSFSAFPATIYKMNIITDGYYSTFEFVVMDDGKVYGHSFWDCCSGYVNTLTGSVSGNRFHLRRHLAGSHVGKFQWFNGTLSKNKISDGKVTGDWGGGYWKTTKIIKQHY